MVYARRNAILGLLACCISAGCGLHTPVLKTGGTGLKGALLNYSCGVHPSDAIDPTKPTIVITHGWNPLPNLIQLSLGSAGAEAIKYRCGDTYNILSWDWNAVRVPPIPSEAICIGREQGLMMAAALRARGIDPTRTQIISHSLGTVVAAQAAICLRDRGPMAQQTFLDPPRMFHRELFENLAAAHYACSVENYWAPGISGFGAPAEYPGVRSYAVEGTYPVLGILDLSMSNHVNVMRWYHQSMVCPSIPYGFQTSILLGHCNTNP
ncbi:MAG: hypothetical protein GXP26_10845 [Planctomycetes bacterium]|nr:hypothetical protein [Planctomycetota bacterium]